MFSIALRNGWRRSPRHLCSRAQQLRLYASLSSLEPERIRNIAIIAHVDHGKTTLVDQLLRQSGTVKQLSAAEQILQTPNSASAVADAGIEDGFVTRVMDSNDLERERGITILSKCTSINYQGNLINIVDTPGHADFGGEVERIMSMVDGVALVVDATEGPMTQTRFVLGKALSRGLRPLVVVNKVDRSTSRVAQVESDLFDLFATLGATDEQADYPLLYASAKQGWASDNPVPPASASTDSSMEPLFNLILSHVPPPTHLASTGPFSMLTVQIENDPYLGVLYLGRVQSGTLKIGDSILALDAEGNKVGEGKVKRILGRMGLERGEKDSAGAGEIVSIAGVKGGGVNVTLVHPDGWGEAGPQPLPTTPIDPPTISIFIYPNDSPLAGKEGNKLTSQLIRERILREAQTNVALKVLPGPTAESVEVRGRGVLHLGVLLETLRREGFELSVGSPKAVMIPNPDVSSSAGKGLSGMLEPIEECTILVKEEFAGTVVQKLTMRKASMISYDSGSHGEGDGWVKIVMEVPSRGLIGYLAGEFKNDVHGQGTLNHIFKGYEPYKGEVDTGRRGSLISMTDGISSAYAMAPLQARGTMFVHPGIQVYPGMVIGEAGKAQDLYLNPCLKKQLTNIRAAGADDKIVLGSPRIMTLEEALSYMGDDEMVEMTPKSIRLRKVILDPAKRMRGGKSRGA